MYRFLAICLGKVIIKIMKLFRYNTTVFPGSVVLKIFPNILNKITYPKLVIMVTGSSGKGSTTSIITKVLKDNGYKVTSNDGGSNLINAFATMIIKDSNLKGIIQSDAICYEVDERFLKVISKYVTPTYLIVNNITRDQPPRQGDFIEIFNEIKAGINEKTTLIVNGDDPLTRRFSLNHKNIIYFGINENFMSHKEAIGVKDNLYCPKCHSKLDFYFYHYSSVGNYKCPKCDFKRDNIKYEITDIDKEKMNITINNKTVINVDNYILFNLYNICSTYAICNELKINNTKIVESLNNVNMNEKIFKEVIIDNRKYISINCKAENNATYNLALLYTSLDDKEKTIVIGLNEISRRYNHFDLSWLWDITFELLNDNNVDKVICAGPYRYDIATRIKYTNIKEENIICLNDLSNLKEELKSTKGTVYGILNFDYVKPFFDSIKEAK